MVSDLAWCKNKSKLKVLALKMYLKCCIQSDGLYDQISMWQICHMPPSCTGISYCHLVLIPKCPVSIHLHCLQSGPKPAWLRSRRLETDKKFGITSNVHQYELTELYSFHILSLVKMNVIQYMYYEMHFWNKVSGLSKVMKWCKNTHMLHPKKKKIWFHLWFGLW